MGVFEEWEAKSWPYRFRAMIVARDLHGGVPSDERVALGWLRSKLQAKDDLIREAVANMMLERGLDVEDAALAEMARNVNGFKRDDAGLYIEGRQLKAAIKEAANVAAGAGKLKSGQVWGETRKGLMGFVAEHIQVEEDRIHLGAEHADGIDQRFVHTFRGSSINYEEYVTEAKLTFHVSTDWDFPPAFWPMVWTTGQRQGIGASRSQGFGTYEVVEWQPVTRAGRRKAK